MLMLSLPSPLGSVWDLSLVIMLFIFRMWLSSGKPFETPEMCFHGESKFCQANNQDELPQKLYRLHQYLAQSRTGDENLIF